MLLRERSLRTKAELIDIYGIESVREVKGRLQVFEQHFLQPGGSVFEWVEAENALPPAELSNPVTFQDAVVVLDDPIPEDPELEDLGELDDVETE